MSRETDRHWTLSEVLWDGYTEALSLSMLICFILSAVSVVAASVPASPDPWSVWAIAALFTVVTIVFLYSSAKRGTRRIWFLSGAMLFGMAAGAGLNDTTGASRGGPVHTRRAPR